MRRRAVAGIVMPVRDVLEIRLTRVKAHLVMEPVLSLIDCGYAGSANRIVRAIATQGR
ncbi:MAG: fold metallo-hydrolase [Chloroflexota bacterium]|nr:fold metallo-hydrolase [Chloroflexota bacterium]